MNEETGTSRLRLLPVRVVTEVDGRRCVLREVAIVEPLAGDPEDPGRVLVRVVDAMHTGLAADSTHTVTLAELLTRAEAEKQLAARRGPGETPRVQ